MLAGEPKSTEDYHEVEADGIKVYVARDLKVAPEGITVKLRGFGMFKYLALEGIRD
ncbi:MAG: hypothetical protein HPY70_12500 [Firmicutes bacterium]|nr:hypothetical protein [Bacillota bacterium]